MSLFNRLLHNAPTCRAKLTDTNSFVVDEMMMENSEVAPGEQARILIARSSVEDPSPNDQFFFKSVLAPVPDSNKAQAIIPNDGIDKLGLEPGDTIVYMVAPNSAFDKFDGPLSEIGTPARDAVASATGRSSVEAGKEQGQVERPEPSSDETTFTNAALFASGQVTFPSDNRNELGVVAGDEVYIEAEHEGNSTTFTAKIGTGNRFNVPKDAQDNLRIDASNSTGDNRINIDRITANRIDE